MKYEEACAALKRTPLSIEQFSFLPEDHRVSLFGEHKLITCIEVLNMKANKGKPWKPDWLNSTQDKWRNYFWAQVDKSKPSCVGFSFGDTLYVSTYSALGSRLHFISQKVAIAAGKDPDMLQYANEWIS